MPTEFRSVLLRASVVAALSLTAIACAKKASAPLEATRVSLSSDMAEKRASFAPPQTTSNAGQQSADRTLAYEHTVSIEIAGELLTARIEAVETACKAVKDGGCTLLEIANNHRNDVPSGRVRMRLAPNAVGDIRTVAGEGGKILDSHTSAEDLAQPIADTERQLALLNLHRQRLTEFMSRKDMKVADLITVSRELATVQSQLDDFGAQRANLRRRVDTELLTINWSPPVGAFQSAESPVLDALKSFGANFKEAIASVITFISFLVPWLIIAIPGFIGIRWSWVRIGAWFARKRQSAI